MEELVIHAQFSGRGNSITVNQRKSNSNDSRGTQPASGHSAEGGRERRSGAAADKPRAYAGAACDTIHLNDIITRHEYLFDDALGKYTEEVVKLYLRDRAQPIYCRRRCFQGRCGFGRDAVRRRHRAR